MTDRLRLAARRTPDPVRRAQPGGSAASPSSALTSHQVHVDEVRLHVARLLWLVPQALEGGGEENEASERGKVTRDHGGGRGLLNTGRRRKRLAEWETHAC